MESDQESKQKQIFDVTEKYEELDFGMSRGHQDVENSKLYSKYDPITTK